MKPSLWSDEGLQGILDVLGGPESVADQVGPADDSVETLVVPAEPSWSCLQAAAFLNANIQKGTHCPACRQNVKLYKRSLNANMVRFLLDLIRLAAQRGVPWVHHRDCTYTGRDYSYLASWGLAVTQAEVEGGTKRTSGMWRATAKGVAFAEGKIKCPAHALMYNRRVFEYQGDPVSITDALGTRFDYSKLMQPASLDK